MWSKLVLKSSLVVLAFYLVFMQFLACTDFFARQPQFDGGAGFYASALVALTPVGTAIGVHVATDVWDWSVALAWLGYVVPAIAAFLIHFKGVAKVLGKWLGKRIRPLAERFAERREARRTANTLRPAHPRQARWLGRRGRALGRLAAWVAPSRDALWVAGGLGMASAVVAGFWVAAPPAVWRAGIDGVEAARTMAAANELAAAGLGIAAIALSTALTLPGAALLVIAAGALLGAWVGLVVAAVGITAGACLAWLAGRLQGGGDAAFDPEIDIDLGVMNEQPSLLLISSRIVRAYPFWLLSWRRGRMFHRISLAASDLPMRVFLPATALGVLPWSGVLVLLGESVSALTRGLPGAGGVPVALGVAAALLAAAMAGGLWLRGQASGA